jgi:hypothetical protein
MHVDSARHDEGVRTVDDALCTVRLEHGSDRRDATVSADAYVRDSCPVDVDHRPTGEQHAVRVT